MAYETKVYIVQKADGEVIGAKTAFQPAHTMAKANAPSRVLFSMADKSLKKNVVGHSSDQSDCK